MRFCEVIIFCSIRKNISLEDCNVQYFKQLKILIYKNDLNKAF